MIGQSVEGVEIVKSVEPESSKEWREREELSTEGPAQKGGAERSELVEMLELSWIGGGILLSGVFFDLSQFNFHGLLFPQKKEDHPHHQDQNHYHGEYNYVSKEVHHVKTSASGSRHKALALEV